MGHSKCLTIACKQGRSYLYTFQGFKDSGPLLILVTAVTLWFIKFEPLNNELQRLEILSKLKPKLHFLKLSHFLGFLQCILLLKSSYYRDIKEKDIGRFFSAENSIWKSNIVLNPLISRMMWTHASLSLFQLFFSNSQNGLTSIHF